MSETCSSFIALDKAFEEYIQETKQKQNPQAKTWRDICQLSEFLKQKDEEEIQPEELTSKYANLF